MKFILTRSYKIIFVVLTLLIASCVAVAQQTSKPSGQSLSGIESEKQAGNNFHSSFASGEFGMDARGIVQGAPFSAVGIKETTQILSDGSRVVHRMIMSIYRDSEGRTRVEWGNDKKTEGVAKVPMIYDAVTGASYLLNQRNHSVVQLPFSIKSPTPRQAKIITPQSPPDNITQVVGETVEPLGTQVIEGVKAEGVRATTTIPAAEMRNNQAAKVVYERWYSQELRRNILIKVTDPRIGEATFKLTNIDRSEPPHDLFVIPADYKLTEWKSNSSAGRERDAPASIKIDSGDRIAVDNRTTGRIRIIGWDKDFVEAKATSERGAEVVKFSVEGASSGKKVWLKADYAKREELASPRPEPEPKPEVTPAGIKPTISPKTSAKPAITYESDDGPPLRDGQPLEVNLEVRVPRNAEIEMIKVVKSSVEIRDVETSLSIFGNRSDVILENVGAADVRTRSGSVEIENASGLVDVVTVSGSIRVRHAGSDVRALSINGDVEIECVSGRVNVDNTDGSIRLTNIRGDVDASTSNSNVTFKGAIREDGRYHLKSMSGAVEMYAQDRPPGFTAILSSYRGIIENDFELKSKQASEHEDTVNRRIIGSYGSGRAQITLDTFDGKVNLHKAAPGAIKECK